jgi:hypothetical protein
MAVAGLPPSVRAESLLRVACAVMSAAAALLLGFSSQTKTVLFVQKKAVSKEVQALWYAPLCLFIREKGQLVLLILPPHLDHAKKKNTRTERALKHFMHVRIPRQGPDHGSRGGVGVPRGPARQNALPGPLRRRRLPASHGMRLLLPRQGTVPSIIDKGQRLCPLLHSIFPDTEAERPVLAPRCSRLNASLSCPVSQHDHVQCS